MMKKLTLLAMAACAVAALAVPAAASATEWTHEGSALKGHANLVVEGPASFNNALVGVDCNQAKFEVTLKGGTDEGEVTSFSVTNPTTECKGTKLLASCIPEQPTPNLPWPVTATSNGRIVITEVEFTSDFSNCSGVWLTPHMNSVTAFPDNPEGIAFLFLSGSVTSPAGSASVSGTLMATAPGTIGIS